LGFKTDLEFYNAANRLIQQEQNTTELAGFLKYKNSCRSNLHYSF